MTDEKLIVKISSALSNKPLFIKISDSQFTVDRIISEAVSTLRNTGRPLEATSLESLAKSHQVFNGGKLISKGQLFEELNKKAQTIGNESVTVAELSLVSSHSGGRH